MHFAGHHYKIFFMQSFLPVIRLGVFLFFVYGCGPVVKVTADYDQAADFSLYKTFTIADISKNGETSELNAPRIANAIREHMYKKGFTEGDKDADLLINAVAVKKLRMSVTANTYGYGGYYRPYGYWGAGMSSSSTTFNTNQYVDGSLIIDIVNNKEQKLLWQGIGNAEIDKAPNNAEAFIQDAVKKIMASFPPKAKK